MAISLIPVSTEAFSSLPRRMSSIVFWIDAQRSALFCSMNCGLFFSSSLRKYSIDVFSPLKLKLRPGILGFEKEKRDASPPAASLSIKGPRLYL